eukprot:SAG31_NODE_1429_length_8390_cov_2.259076_3_plen_99_part_00
MKNVSSIRSGLSLRASSINEFITSWKLLPSLQGYFVANTVGPIFAGTLSDALGGTSSPTSLRTVLLLGAVLPLTHAATVWYARHFVGAEIVSAAPARH